MASDYVKLVGHSDPQVNYGSVKVSDDEEVFVGVPTNKLSASDKKKLEERGYVFESSSKSEAEEAEQSAGSDVTGTAPVLGQVPGKPNQPRDTGDDKK